MRKLICVLLALMLAGGASAFAEPAWTPPADEAVETPAPEPLDPEVVEAQLTAMLPVLDSFARILDDAGETAYDPASADFVWNQLYQLAVNWYQPDPNGPQDPEDWVSVPADALLTYAAASFAGLEALPELPQAEVPPRIIAGENGEMYAFARSEPRQVYVVVERYAADVEGIRAGIGLYESAYNFRLGGLTALLEQPVAEEDATEADIPGEDGEAAEAPAEEPEATGEDLPEAEAEGELPGEAADAEGEGEPAGGEAEAAAEEAPESLSFPLAVRDIRPETEADFAALEPIACYIRYRAPSENLLEEVLLPFNSLSWGSSGAEVAALQRRLNALGYSCGEENGVFGAETLRAVRYFQDALGVTQDGVANVDLQNRLFSADAPVCQPYANLYEGRQGVRVEELQDRLRELGYLAKPVDGNFDDRTRAAVVLFQSTAALGADGIAGINTLTALAADDAPFCPEFVELRFGDTGPRVIEMQEQLLSLGLLSGWANGVYDNATAAAVRAYVQANAIDEDGSLGVSALTIARMFGLGPTPEPTVNPTSSPEPTLAPEDASAPEATAAPEGAYSTPSASPLQPTPALEPEDGEADEPEPTEEAESTGDGTPGNALLGSEGSAPKSGGDFYPVEVPPDSEGAPNASEGE